jgi:excisionase family DNA binding protein
MDKKDFLTTKELAKRWNMSHRTLEQWRCQGKGLPFFKTGRKVNYRIQDIEAYEKAHTTNK